MSENSLAQKDTLVILHFNDTHSNLFPLAPREEDGSGTRGGIARAVTFIGMNKMLYNNVLTLHSGDFCTGDLMYNCYYGVPELKMLNEIGVDAMTIGLHEFDLNPSTLCNSLKLSGIESDGLKITCANIILTDEAVYDLCEFIKPNIIKEYGNFKVGIFGITTPEINTYSQPFPAQIDENLVGIANEQVTNLLNEDCDFIICLSHLGIDLDKFLVQNVPGINLIVGGNNHYCFEQPIIERDMFGREVRIVQAGAFYSHIGQLKLAFDQNGYEFVDYEMVPLDESIVEDENTISELNNLCCTMESTYGFKVHEPIAFAAGYFEEVAENLYQDIPHDTPIGHLVTDAFKWTTGTDIGFTAGGATAQPIYAGPVTPEDIFRMIGYGFNTSNGLDYKITTFNISGEQLYKGLESCLALIQNNDEMLPHFSGMKVTFDLNRNVGSKITSIEIENKIFHPYETYSVTTNEYLLKMLETILAVQVSDIVIYNSVSEFQAVMEYVIYQQLIVPYGGIVEMNERSIDPAEFLLMQNFPNPFNSETNIVYQLKKDSHVILKVYDLLGREVRELVNSYEFQGIHKIKFRADDLSSGIYFCNLNSNGRSICKKFILLR